MAPKTFTEKRADFMKKLTGWSDAEGKTNRPRSYGLAEGESATEVAWEYNDNPSDGDTLTHSPSAKWKRYADEDSRAIEHAYLSYQQFVFFGTPSGAPGPYCIDFRCEGNPDHHSGKPIQFRADADKTQGWRQRAVRRVKVA
jgi:hypothetical protein